MGYKKKIGLITIIDNKNYGNRLQNYAMQCFLHDCGFQVETIKFSSNSLVDEQISNSKRKLLQSNFIVKVRNCIMQEEYIVNRQIERLNQRRVDAFLRFNRQYISFCKYKIRANKVPEKIINRFDYFVVGSDQIWNPNYKQFDKYITYLKFAPKEKRIAISPSFGVASIPSEQHKIIAEYLKEMAYISVREESGQKIVEELTGKTCDILFDPTLLVEPKIWQSILQNTNVQLPDKYLLTYFLGELSEDRKKYIEECANVHKLQIIHMNSTADETSFVWGPEGFVKAIYGSSIFLTDSFHGCVFSVLFHKQFGVFRREDGQADMFGRIDTLLKVFNLCEQEIREMNSVLNIVEENQFEQIDNILKAKRDWTRRKIQVILQ